MFQAGSTCYPSAVQALSASVSAQVGSVSGGHVVAVDAVAADSVTYRFTPLAGGSPLTMTVPLSPQPCQLLQASDALALAWPVVLVWCVAAGFRYLRQSLNIANGGSDDS